MTIPVQSSSITAPDDTALNLTALGATAEAAEHSAAAVALRGAAEVHRTGGHAEWADMEARLADDVAGDSDHQLRITQALLLGAEPC